MTNTGPLAAEAQAAAQAAAQAETPGVTTWVLDPAHTVIEFSAKHMMFTTVKGHFGTFRGAIRVDEAHPERSSVAVEIDATSLDTRTEMRDNHLRSEDFLHVEVHPTITFTSRRLELPASTPLRPGQAFKVVGDLTVRGTTREVVLDATFAGEGTGPFGTQIKAFAARTKLNRKDFGLAWNVALETGGWLVGDEITIEIEAQANPQGAPTP
jgi:polyisoprenoid-binding protein YceI